MSSVQAAEAATSIESNKAVYLRWFEEVVKGADLALAEALLAPDYVFHFPGAPAPLGREDHMALVMMFRTAFPDWVEAVEDVIAEGDKVVVRVAGTGTHQGEFQGIPPTGRRGRCPKPRRCR